MMAGYAYREKKDSRCFVPGKKIDSRYLVKYDK